MNENWYKGSDIKLHVEIDCTGFDIHDDDWYLEVYIDKKLQCTITKEECVQDDDGEYYCCIDKDSLKKTGDLFMVTHALVPDEDFANDGVRDEVDKVRIGKYQKI